MTEKTEKKETPATTAQQAATNELALYKRDVVDAVARKVEEYIKNGELNLPKDYSVNNAIKAAWLVLQTTEDKNHVPALQVCTRNSVANALLDMIVQGLNTGKDQAYFIVYGKTLTCMRSYFGSMAVAEMVNPKIAAWGHKVIYEEDNFSYEIKNGKIISTTHKQSISNINKTKILGAYCAALDKDNNYIQADIMTFEEIKQAWKQSPMHPISEKGDVKTGTTHGNFTADMALRTVISKTCKFIINKSSDSTLLLERINRNEDLASIAAAETDIEENANTGELLSIETEPKTQEKNTENNKDTEKTNKEGIAFVCPDCNVKVTEHDCEVCTSQSTCTAYKQNIKQPAPLKMPGF